MIGETHWLNLHCPHVYDELLVHMHFFYNGCLNVLLPVGLSNGNNSLQVNEEASDKVLEVEQKYNKIRRPVYVRRNEIIQKIPDFWLTAVCNILLLWFMLLPLLYW